MAEKLSRKTKIIYGAGDLGFSLTSTIIGAYFLLFLTDVIHLRPAYAGIAILAGKIWDWVNDPLIGHISDRTRSRWGRRRPFLLFGALPFALAFVMMWYRPPFESNMALVIYYAAAYVVFDAAATFVYMPYFALTPELTEDYDERTALTSYRMFFSIFGSLLAFTLPLVIVGSFSPENAPKVLMMAAIFAVISALPLWLLFFNIKEKETYAAQEKPKLIPALKAAFQNRPFVFGAMIYLLTWICIDVIQAVLLFFVKYVLQLEQQSDLVMALIFVTGIFALPIWEYASRKMEKRKAYVVGIAFFAVVLMVLITLNATTPFWIVVLVCILAGIGVSAAHVLPWAMMPDAIEWDEYKTGERHEGVFYSLITLMLKIATSIAIPLTAVILDIANYVPNAIEQPASALLSFRLLIGPIPAVLMLVAIVFALRYPLDRESYSQVVEELEERRVKA